MESNKPYFEVSGVYCGEDWEIICENFETLKEAQEYGEANLQDYAILIY